mgnify:CR=1 FL=1
MIKKIQTYLLENYPLLWNIRIFPIGILILVVNLIFFALGYVFTDTSFNGKSYYRPLGGDLSLVYFASIVISIIIFVTWLIFYFRNNALKVYYPRRTSHVLLEWIICYILCIGITFIPRSLNAGSNYKWEVTTSVEEAEDALKIIYKAQQLMPYDMYSDKYDADKNDTPIPVPEEFKKNIKLDSANLSRYAFEYDKKNNIIIKGYIGPSLLFYKARTYFYYLECFGDSLSSVQMNKDINEVKLWLQNGDTTKIKSLMKDYMQLINKHKLKTSINTDQWFKRIYNPPFFQVDTSTVILRSILSSTLFWDDKRYAVNTPHPTYETISAPLIENDTLTDGYERIIQNRNYAEDFRVVTLFCLCLALALSILVFSYRVTGGRKWLKSLLFVGIFALCSSLLTALISQIGYSDDRLFVMTIVCSWLLLFIITLGLLLYKVYSKAEKTKSNVAITISLWFIPCVFPLIYALIAIFLDYNYREFLEKTLSIESMYWINLIVSVIAMVPASILVRKWKSLAEE